MAITLKDETVIREWEQLLLNTHEHRDKLMDDIESKLDAANISDFCSWSREEVQSSGWFSKVKREFIIVKNEQFKDYRTYISAHIYGTHLYVSWFVTVEPGFLKKTVSDRLSKSLVGKEVQGLLSAPKNILIAQDLSAWSTITHEVVLEAVSELMDALGQDPSMLRRDVKEVLQGW